MTKKKKGINGRIIGGIIGAGVILAVVIPVLFLVTGVGNENILPQAEPSLEIPIPVIPPPDLSPIIEQPEQFCTVDQNELRKIAECKLQTQDEQTVQIQNLPADQCSQVSKVTVEQCTEQIDDLINEILEESQPEIEPIKTNGTETSIDNPYTQLCDQNPELIICGDSKSLELITKVLKIDSAGVQTTVQTTTGIPRLSFFVEDTSNIDYSKGKLQFEVKVKGDPNLSYLGNGKVDILIGTQSIFTEPINVKVDGIADSEGMVDLLFISPTGIPSGIISFDFADNLNKFPDEAITPVRFHFIELNIDGEREQKFALVDQDSFTMDIARDTIKLLITDEEGLKSRVYPSDSRITVTGKTNTSDPYSAGTTRVETWDSIFYGNGLGCSQFTLISSVNQAQTTGLTTTVPAPILSVTILDDEGNIVKQSSGTTSFSFNTLTRNSNYTLKVNGLTSIPLDFGKSQETKSFTCTQKGTANTVGFSTPPSGDTGICGYYTISSGTTLSTTNPVTIKPNSFSCNFPQ